MIQLHICVGGRYRGHQGSVTASSSKPLISFEVGYSYKTCQNAHADVPLQKLLLGLCLSIMKATFFA